MRCAWYDLERSVKTWFEFLCNLLGRRARQLADVQWLDHYRSSTSHREIVASSASSFEAIDEFQQTACGDLAFAMHLTHASRLCSPMVTRAPQRGTLPNEAPITRLVGDPAQAERRVGGAPARCLATPACRPKRLA
jgi:hypothetical protein